MKKYITILTIALIASACGDENLDQKREKLSGLKSEMLDLKTKIKTLENEIFTLDPTKKEENYTLVAIVSPSKGMFEHRIDMRGGIQSRKNVVLSAEMGGKIQSIKVKEGQKVSKGQTLIVINADVIRRNISELNTALELANTLYERQDKLWKQQIGTEIQYLQAKNRKESLEGKLATANAQLAMSIIKAPFGGMIDDLPVNEGELASPGRPLIRLLNPKDVYIASEISEAFIGKIKKGDNVVVNFINENKKYNTVITSVSSVIKAANRTFSVELEMPQTDFEAKPNQVVVISMRDYQEENAITLSTNILLKDNAGNFIYKSSNKDGKLVAEKVHITLGKTFNGKTEILTGLTGNESVISEGFRDVAHGAVIKVK